MKYSYYPGCSMSTTGNEYGKSIDYVNAQLGLEFLEIPDWNCCGATAGHTMSHDLGKALAARNVALCEAQNLGHAIVAPCANCYNRMKIATHYARHGEAEKLSRLIEMPITGQLDVVTLMEVYNEPETREKIKVAIKKPLTGLKVACYYGCLYARPRDIFGKEDAEDPQSMDEAVRLTGAEPVDWAFKTECCGASHHVDLPKESKPLLRRIYSNARASGAQAFVVACPMCMMNLDMRQGAVNMLYGEEFDLPVYFISELLAAAMGGALNKIGVSTHFHPAKKLLQQVLSAAPPVAAAVEGGATHG